MQLVSMKWIIKEKEKKVGKIWKARLVVRGFIERFDEKYECEAPTCSAEGLKLVLAVIKTFGWRVRILDVKTPYLQGKVYCMEVYLQPTVEARSQCIWQLKKTVYGIKNAAKHWYESLIEILKEMVGRKCVVDGTIFYWKNPGGLYGIMRTHVDDYVLVETISSRTR